MLQPPAVTPVKHASVGPSGSSAWQPSAPRQTPTPNLSRSRTSPTLRLVAQEVCEPPRLLLTPSPTLSHAQSVLSRWPALSSIHIPLHCFSPHCVQGGLAGLPLRAISHSRVDKMLCKTPRAPMS